MTNSTRKWIRGGLETFIHGGASAVTAAVGVNMIDPKDWGASLKTAQLAGACFLINGGWRFLQWWAANPLPPDDAATVSLNPLSPTIKPQTTN